MKELAAILAVLFVLSPLFWSDGDSALVEVVVEDATDTDGDGVIDVVELALGLDPNDPDSDDDGFRDDVELWAGTNPRDPRSRPSLCYTGDVDGDGVVDAVDVQLVINAALQR